MQNENQNAVTVTESFWKNNKGRIIRVIVLLFVFAIITAYVNGRNIYKDRVKQFEANKQQVATNTAR